MGKDKPNGYNMDSQTCAVCRVSLSPISKHFSLRKDFKSGDRYRRQCKSCRVKRVTEQRKTRKRKSYPRKPGQYTVVTPRGKMSQEQLARARAKDRRAYLTMKEQARFRKAFATAIRGSLKGNKSGRSWERIVEYTVHDLRRHLEKQFVRGMTWSNHGSHWHIDHILPMKMFAFTSPDDPDFHACWALTNLRPLQKSANLRKHAKRLHLI